MPLGRFTVRNEYGLGVKELYREGVESEDPKAVLDGVAVAGLVGLLRQLGDLSQFAAEVFHGLQEQVASTVSRSRKLVNRVQHIEASLPSLEKAILSQTSHIHFAYSPGSEWHPRIKNEQNHFIIDDLPHFIMDSYEECHEPPRLQLLDRFDKGGAGSCLQRYSDPTFFRRTSASAVLSNKEKSQLERKVRKMRRKRSRQRSERFSSCVPTMNSSERVQSSSQTGGEEPSLSQTGSTFNKISVSDREDQSESLGSVNSTQPNKTKNKELSSTVDENMVDTSQTIHPNEQITMADKGVHGGFACHNNVPDCDVTWDEKLEIMEHMGLTYGIDDAQHVPATDYYLHQKDINPVSVEHVDQVDDFSEDQLIELSGHDFFGEHGVKIDDAENSQGDDVSEITSCTESDADVHCFRTTTDEKFLESTERNYSHDQQVKPLNVLSFNDVEGSPEHGSSSESNAHGKYPTTILNWDMDPTTQKDNGIDDVKDFDDTNFDLHEHVSVQMYSEPFPEGKETSHEDNLVLANIDSFPRVTEFSEDENPPKFIVNSNLANDSFDRMFFGGGSFDSKLRIGDVQYMLETIEKDKWAMETVKPEHGENSHESISDNKLRISDGNYALENKLEQYDGPVDTSTEQVNNMHLIEWPCHDDIDSETDNFVDALNTIDSESESEYETQTKTEVEPSTSERKLLGYTSTDLMIPEINQSKPEREIYSRKYHHDDIVYGGLEQPTAPLFLHNTEGRETSVSSFQEQTATSQEQDAQIPPLTTSSQAIDETLTESKVDHSTSECELTGNASIGVVAENVNQFQPELDFQSRMYGSDDQVCDGSEQPTSLENAVSMQQSEVATTQEHNVIPCFSQGIEEIVTKEQLDPSSDLEVENRNRLEAQHQLRSRMYDRNDGVYDGSKQHTSPSPPNLEYLENAVSSHQPGPETSQEHEVVPCFSHEQSVMQSTPSLSVVSQSVDICDSTEEIRSQPVVCKPVESTSQASQDNMSESTNSYPRNLWTNGTLFGLQPSKPTVVSTSNSAPISGAPRKIMSSSAERHGVNLDKDGQDVGSLKHDRRNINDDLGIPGPSNGEVTIHKSKVPSSANLKNVCSEAANTSEDRSSLLSLLGRSLLSNGVRRSASLDYNNDGNKTNDAAVQDLVPQSNLKSSLSSPPPSPPLEHMKISFRPIDTIETSRLKLKYPEGVDSHEMTVETFPSFQLVPEPNLLQHGTGSDSDDDTFCRSYPCVSDDSVGQLSDSDSEQWESGDSSGSNDHAFFDGFRQISSTESTSSQQDDTEQRNRNKFDLQDVTPQLPPLPPLQWRASRPVLDEAKAKPGQGSDNLKRSDNKVSESANSAKLQSGMCESGIIGTQEKVAEVKVHAQKQNFPITSENTVDDRDDFLHQIRTKSFNLKRTDAARALHTPSLSTSNKVTAILQKASAIRKAVGSDAEDDSWSDT